MPKAIVWAGIINGFEIIKDLGRTRKGNKNKYLLVKCKECNKKFETSATSIHRIKSCGCKPIRLAKKLEDEINGFKIIKDLGYTNGSRRAIVICKVCQKEYEVDPNKLVYRNHCGCIKNGSKVSKFAHSHPRLRGVHKHMMSRCYNPNNQDYRIYGAKGIIICDEWKGNPDKFCEWALSNGYKDNLSIDRIDSSGNYEPNNCRWATPTMQSRNINRNVLTIELARQIRNDIKILKSIGITMTLGIKELAKKYKVSKGTIIAVAYNRIWIE
jgi:hypothetical protein